MKPGCLPAILLLALSALPSAPLHSAESIQHRAFGGIQPALSRDGSAIALSYQGAICTLPAQGGALTRLTRGDGWDIEPAWSPDGRHIAFINAPGFFTGALRVISSQDGSPSNLPSEILARGRLHFHPDGKRILGMFTTSGRPDRLQWLDLSSGGLTPFEIPSLDAFQRSTMQWALSPDGASILFVTYQDKPGEQSGNNGPAADLWRVPSTGGDPQKITRWPSRIYNLCWAATGDAAFVVTDRGVAYNDIWHIPFERPLPNARKISFGQADEDWPNASSDGFWLLHTENHDRATSLARLNLASGQRQSVPIDRIDFREPTGTLRVKITDAGAPSTARLSLKQAGGKFHFPLGSLYRFTSGFGHFYARHEAELTLPAGKYTLHAWRGPEYSVHRQEIEIAPGQSLETTVALQRWINMPDRGFFSGENHIHANYGYGAWHNDPQSIRDQCEGEDLHVANVVVANSDGDGVFDRQYFLGEPDPLSTPRAIIYWNEEFRSTIWGHLTLGNLTQIVEPIFTGFKDTTNPWDIPTNADIAERARLQRGTVSYTHPASNLQSPYDGAYAGKGIPVDVALGRVDTLDVMGVGYEASRKIWYHLLNCGFRIPAAAGTDVFLNRIASFPPGWGRCYVRLTNQLSYPDWIKGQKAGHSFVTTGPMLEWDLEGRSSGEALRLEAPRSVRVRARARSQFPLTSLELIVNGAVIQAAPGAGGDARELALDAEITLDRAGWVAVRSASGRDPSWPGITFGAHANPVFIEMPNRPLDARADAGFFLQWIDRLEADLKKRDRVPKGWEHVNLQIDFARKAFKRISENTPPR